MTPTDEHEFLSLAFTLLRAATGYSVCRECCRVFRIQRGAAGVFCSRACYEAFPARRRQKDRDR